VHCGHRLASASYYTAADLYSTVCKTVKTLCKKITAIMEVFYCFTVAIGLPGDASSYNQDKKSTVAMRIQNKVVIE